MEDGSSSGHVSLRALRQASGKTGDSKLVSSLKERATNINSPARPESPDCWRRGARHNSVDGSLISDNLSEVTSPRSCGSAPRSCASAPRSGTSMHAGASAPSLIESPGSSARLPSTRQAMGDRARQPLLSYDSSEDTSPRRQRGTETPLRQRDAGASQGTGKLGKGLPAELGYLRDLVSGGADRLVKAQPEWKPFVKSLTASVEAEVETHVKMCSKCRAFSSFSKNLAGRKKTALSELTLSSLCRGQNKALNEHIGVPVLQQKDSFLAKMAESLSLAPEELLNYEGINERRLETSFASLGVFVEERDRILGEAHLREELNVALAMLRYLRGAQRAWRVAAPKFPHRKIDHQRMSVVTHEEIEECINQQVSRLSAVLANQVSDWEAKWDPVGFHDVFNVFGVPIYDAEIKAARSHHDATGTRSVEEGMLDSWQGWKELDEGALTSEEIASVPPMAVVVRIRPSLSHEAGDDITSRALEDGISVSFTDSDMPGSARHRLVVDAAVQGTSQAEFFSKSGVKALVHKAVEGYVASIFAYGQTGAGKTHSLLGPESCILQLADDDIIDQHGILPAGCRTLIDDARRAKVCKQGLLPRAVQFLWKLLWAETDGGVNSLRTVRVSFLEVYNEKIFDLLQPDAPQQLDVRQRSGTEVGFQVPGLSVVRCESAEAVLLELRGGCVARHTQGHSLSRDSSRAHAIFTMEIDPHPGSSKAAPGGKLIFADLAGSERQNRVQGAAAKETAAINKSLFALSNCIAALAASSDASTISVSNSNFRNSKLTKLLMESLVGAGYTMLVAAASPAARHADETAATFAFAAKCAHVRRQAEPILTPHAREVQELHAVINSLRDELAEARQATPSRRDVDLDAEESGELAELRETLERERLRFAHWMEKQIVDTVSEMAALRSELEEERLRSSQLEDMVQNTDDVASNSTEKHLVHIVSEMGSLRSELDEERQRTAQLEEIVQNTGNVAAYWMEKQVVDAVSEVGALRSELEEERQKASLLEEMVQHDGNAAALEIERIRVQLDAECKRGQELCRTTLPYSWMPNSQQR